MFKVIQEYVDTTGIVKKEISLHNTFEEAEDMRKYLTSRRLTFFENYFIEVSNDN